jgi:ABC-type multidrug transport system ATPase subunit
MRTWTATTTTAARPEDVLGKRSRAERNELLLTALLEAPRSTSHAVSATALTRTYGHGDSAVHALRGVSLDLPAGQFTAVMGPSGSGKSTLMHLLAGLDTPTSGTVEVAGQEITRMKDRDLTRLRRTHIGFVFQSFTCCRRCRPRRTSCSRCRSPASARRPRRSRRS